MMAGLSVDERAQLGLEGYTVRDLMYLNLGTIKIKNVKKNFFFLIWITRKMFLEFLELLDMYIKKFGSMF